MDVPKYLQALWSFKWLLLVGLVIAVICGLFAGFTVNGGKLESRAERSFTASSTVLVSAPNQPLFQAEIPGQPIAEGMTAPIQQDLSKTAVVFAYLVSGSEVRTAVEAQIGPLADDEHITAIRRTTQPGGDERFPGRLSLPILDIVGVASTPGRAETISRTASAVFQEHVLAEQDAVDMPTDERVVLATVQESPAVEDITSNPAIPIVITILGVFLAFVALAFLLANAAQSRARRRAATDGDGRPNRRGRRRARGAPDGADAGEDAPDGAIGLDDSVADPESGPEREPALAGER